jgi:hypothetical protein
MCGRCGDVCRGGTTNPGGRRVPFGGPARGRSACAGTIDSCPLRGGLSRKSNSDWDLTRVNLYPVVGLTILLAVVGCCSTDKRPAQQGPSAEQQVALNKPEAARQMVQTGKQEYREGRLRSAEALLQIATLTDPQNNEAWYWLNRTRQAINDLQNELGLWYSGIRPAVP